MAIYWVLSLPTNNPSLEPFLSKIINISSKGEHFFVKKSGNEIFAFGSNYSTQLGIKTDDENQFSPIQVFQDITNIKF